jgi:cytochrome oxidase Cu insertion factor (SCO1/SenC/PrrC family)
MNQPANNVENRNPYTLWFVVLAFVAPVILAYILYFSGAIKTFANHGEILDPVVDIVKLELMDDKDISIPRDSFTRKWRLISFVGSNCDESCNAKLYDVRQVHISLGKDQDRVERLIVHLEPPSEQLIQLLRKEYPKAINVYGDEKKISAALGKDAMIGENELYIMDPIGNVMMRFTQDQSKKDFQSDLKKLLKVSQIG